MANKYASVNRKGFLDYDGLVYIFRMLNQYPTNDLLTAVIEGISDALDDKIDTSARGAANGVAALGADGKIVPSQLPASTNTTYTITQDAADGHIITLAGNDGTSVTITIPDNNTTYSAATQSKQGLMSTADKKKLDGIDLSQYVLLSEVSELTAADIEEIFAE